MTTKDKILQAAQKEYNNPPPFWNKEQYAAAQAALRGMTARLGLYDEFLALLNQHQNTVGFRSDGSPISAYAPDGGPVGGRG